MTLRQDPGHPKRPQTFHTHPTDAIHQRIISAPLATPLAGPLSAPFQSQHPSLYRSDSPARPSPNNTVEFPKSARLKPLDLGNPFYNREHGPKRRATLPSLIITANEAADISNLPRQGEDVKATGASFGTGQRTVDTRQTPNALTVTSRMDKRRSRSANDLKQAMVAAEFRDRTGEIEYWRRSYASVLLSPTGKAPIYEYPPADAEFDETHVPDVPDVPEVPEHFAREPEFVSVPTPLSAHPPLPRSDAVSIQSARGQSVPAKNPSPELTVRSFSRPLTTPAPDATTDLESRVAKLEAHLVDFQRSLPNLTLSSPSAVATTEPPGSSHRQKPPSIFVEPLKAPARGYEDAGDIMEREWGPSSQSSTNGDRSNLAPPTLRSTAAANGTFTALYNMLSEERSARRTLENQVRNLQHEVTRLQLSRGSWGSYSAQALPQGQRPRTPAESDGGRSASRLEAYNALSSPATVVPPPQYLRAFDRPDARIQSRFSGDSAEDSEYGSRHRSALVDSGRRSIPRSSIRQTPPNYEHDRVEPPTPYENYSTPAEERDAYRFSEDEMF